MFKLAIFDLDGTLLDTISDLADAGNFALKKLGFPVHSVSDYKIFVGNGVYNLITRILPADVNNDESVIKQALEFFNEHYSKNSSKNTNAYPGIINMLNTIKQSGVKTAVLSNKPHDYTEVLVKQYFPNLIDMAWGKKDDFPAKPNPASLNAVIDAFGIDKKQCIYIGDSDVDMLVAANANVTSVGVLWGFRNENELIEAGASKIATNTQELEKVILDK